MLCELSKNEYPPLVERAVCQTGTRSGWLIGPSRPEGRANSMGEGRTSIVRAGLRRPYERPEVWASAVQQPLIRYSVERDGYKADQHSCLFMCPAKLIACFWQFGCSDGCRYTSTDFFNTSIRRPRERGPAEAAAACPLPDPAFSLPSC